MSGTIIRVSIHFDVPYFKSDMEVLDAAKKLIQESKKIMWQEVSGSYVGLTIKKKQDA